MALNFIPADVRAARACARRVRVWCVVSGVSAAAFLGGAWVWSVQTGVERERADAQAQARQAQTKLDEAAKELAALTKDLAGAQRDAEFAALVGQHPDWAALLALLASIRGEDVALEGLEVERLAVAQAPGNAARGAPGARPSPAGGQAVQGGSGGAGRERAAREPDDYLVRLAAVAANAAAAQQFVVRLEALGLFDAVQLIETRPRALRTGEGAAFRVECRLGERDRPEQARSGGSRAMATEAAR
jgi:hypothetical protein